MKRGILLSTAWIALGLIAGCQEPAGTPDNTAGETSEATVQVSDTAPVSEVPEAQTTNLSERFDCVREENGLLLAAHRGGPDHGYPENAIESLQHALNSGIPVMEIDVAESRDGVLFLMHDRSLTRTTTGSGAVADTNWDTISSLQLVDNDGKVTKFHAPRLSEALDWAVETGALLELDRKPTTSFRNIIEAVRESGAENNVLIITYNDEEAWQVADLAPDLMMTAGVGNREHEAALLEGGVDPTRLIAWTGTSQPSPGKWRGLASKGIESGFGTLGRAGERLDDQYWADGDPEEYEALVESGLVLLATDRPYEIGQAGGTLGGAITRADTCLR